MRKILLFSFKLGKFRLFLEKHEWVDRYGLVPKDFVDELIRIEKNRIFSIKNDLKPKNFLKVPRLSSKKNKPKTRQLQVSH